MARPPVSGASPACALQEGSTPVEVPLSGPLQGQHGASVAINLEICTPDLNSSGNYSTENVGTFIEGIISDSVGFHINSGNIKVGQSTII